VGDGLPGRAAAGAPDGCAERQVPPPALHHDGQSHAGMMSDPPGPLQGKLGSMRSLNSRLFSVFPLRRIENAAILSTQAHRKAVT
jgi:hypothetical protein